MSGGLSARALTELLLRRDGEPGNSPARSAPQGDRCGAERELEVPRHLVSLGHGLRRVDTWPGKVSYCDPNAREALASPHRGLRVLMATTSTRIGDELEWVPAGGLRAFMSELSPWRLVVLSMLLLFVELALIRWTAANNVHLASITNFVLLASFLGIGIGFLRADSRWSLLALAPVTLALLVGFVLAFPVSIN